MAQLVHAAPEPASPAAGGPPASNELHIRGSRLHRPFLFNNLYKYAVKERAFNVLDLDIVMYGSECLEMTGLFD